MNGKLDDYGYLCIERVDRYRAQECPYACVEHQLCGDWCAKFGEPYMEMGMVNGDVNSIWGPTGRKAIKVCGDILVFTEFKDERKELDVLLAMQERIERNRLETGGPC